MGTPITGPGRDRSADASRPDFPTATIRVGETTLEQVARRLGITEAALKALNPQIDPAKVQPGQEIRVPEGVQASTDQSPTAASSNANTQLDTQSKKLEANLDALGFQYQLRRHNFKALSSPADGTGVAADDPSARSPDADSVQSRQPKAFLPDEPRFVAVNEALKAGHVDEVLSTAKKLLAQLQAEKPPNQGLLNEVRMTMAAAAMMDGDLDEAQKALVSISPKTLSDPDKAQFDELRNALKDVRSEAYAEAFDADPDDGQPAGAPGTTATDQARKLLEFLRKTEPENTLEIDNARMRLANGLLVNGHYREAEQALVGIHEKQLVPEMKGYLGAIRQEVHAQQIDALGNAYVSDMKRKNYKEAVSNATALVNDLAKYFPEAKTRITAARLEQATAQVMNNDVAGARKSLGHITRGEFNAAPEELRERYKDLNSYIDKYTAMEQQQRALQAEIQNQLKTMDRLVSSGDKGLALDAIAMGQKLEASLESRFPNNPEIIAGVKLSIAAAQLAAGDTSSAKALLQKVADNTDDLEIKDQAQLLTAQADLQEGHTDQAVKTLRVLSEKAESSDLRSTAKNFVVEVESSYLEVVGEKAGSEEKQIKEVAREKWGIASSTNDMNGPVMTEYKPTAPIPHVLDPETATKLRPIIHERALKDLRTLRAGAYLAADVMKQNHMTASELQGMSERDLAKLPLVGGEEDAHRIKTALANSDAQAIARDDFHGKHFSWDRNNTYVDTFYLDTPVEFLAKGIGGAVRSARREDEELKKSNSLLARGLGYFSAGILDGISTADGFVKDKIKSSYDFYHRQGGVLGKLGLAATFIADSFASIGTMPASILDYKVSDEERAAAMTGTVLLVGTAGLLKAGGPMLDALGGRIATSRFGQWLRQTKLGELGVKIASGLRKEIKFGKGKLADATTIDQAVEEILKHTSPAELRANVTEFQIKEIRKSLFDDLRKANPASVTDSAIRSAVNGIDDDAVRRMVIGQQIYDNIYHVEMPPNTVTKAAQTSYERQLASYEGPTATEGKWRIRENTPLVHVHGETSLAQVADKLRSQGMNVDLQALRTANPTIAEATRLQPGQAIRVPMAAGEAVVGGGESTLAQVAERLQKQGVNIDLAKLKQLNPRIGDASPLTPGQKIALPLEHGIDGEPVRRFYMNLSPEKAAEVFDAISAELNAKGIRFNFKVPEQLRKVTRADAGVLYVAERDYASVKKMVLEYAKNHPDAFREGTLGFTKTLGKGISAAEEPLQDNLPYRPRGHSYGSSRSDLISEALLKAPPGATKQEISRLVRENLQKHGIDPDRPWLRSGQKVDDL